MKKKATKPNVKSTEFDKETLKHWRSVSTKAKLDWLDSALKLAKMGKF